MSANPFATVSRVPIKIRNVILILVGVAILLLKRSYAGPLEQIVHSYAGNVSVSFALYFNFLNLNLKPGINRVVAAASALTVVELFEAFNGFGFMANTYDPIDFAANAIGVALAFGVDRVLSSYAARYQKAK
jgi:hypothetical protein